MGRLRSVTGVRGIKIRNGKYVIDKRYMGISIYETLNTTSIDEAQAILSERIIAIRNGKYFPERDGHTLTVTDALEYLWEKRLKHKHYHKEIKPVLAAVDSRLSNKSILELTRSDMEMYKRERARDKKKNRCEGLVGPRQIQKELQHLSMAINLLVDDGKIASNPIRRFIKVQQPTKDKVVFDECREYGLEWKALYESMCASVRPIILVLYETAMRPIELFHMQWNWLTEVGIDRYTINVPAIILINEDGFREKTMTAHRIPVSLPLLETLRRLGLRRDNSLVFPSPKSGGPRKDIESAFTNALKRAGLTGRNYSPYTLRRTRLSIWDKIDSPAAKYVAGHVFQEIHHFNYVDFSNDRLFRLVGLDFQPGAQM